MEMATTETRAGAAPAQTLVTPPAPESPPLAATRAPASNRIPSIIVAVVTAAVAGLSIYYLVRGQPLLVQGEVDATRFDIAARVDGRVADVPVERGENIDAGAVLVRIDRKLSLLVGVFVILPLIGVAVWLLTLALGGHVIARSSRGERAIPAAQRKFAAAEVR